MDSDWVNLLCQDFFLLFYISLKLAPAASPCVFNGTVAKASLDQPNKEKQCYPVWPNCNDFSIHANLISRRHSSQVTSPPGSCLMASWRSLEQSHLTWVSSKISIHMGIWNLADWNAVCWRWMVDGWRWIHFSVEISKIQRYTKLSEQLSGYFCEQGWTEEPVASRLNCARNWGVNVGGLVRR